jgi:hypothetical protein
MWRIGRKTWTTAAVVAAWALAPGAARAASGEEQIPVGPRPLALGGAFTAIADGVDALYWNPAGLGRLRVSSVRVTTSDLHGLGIRDNVVTLVSPTGMRFGLGIEWYNSGFNDGTIDDSINRLNFGVGWHPLSQLSVGTSIKYRQYSQAHEGVDQGRGSGVGFDLGVLFQPLRQLSVGAMWRDIGGSTLDFEDGDQSRPFDSMFVIGFAGRPHRSVLLTSDLGRDFHVGAEVLVVKYLSLRAGWSKDLEGLDSGRFAAGFAARWGPAQVEYAYQDHSMLDGTHTFGATFDFTLAPQLVEINDLQMEPLFASFYKSYATEEPGQLVVTNLDENPVQAQVRIEQSDLMDEPSVRTVFLRPGVTQEVELPLVFPPSIVEQIETRPITFNVEVTYQSAGRRRTEKREVQTFLYGTGTLNWSGGVARAAAFVTPTHAMVDAFTRDIVRVTANQDTGFLNRSTSLAARLFDGMSACGLTYTPDPLNPYAEVQGKSFAVDNIQYPAELLVSRTGDCDDSSVLYASMLSNVGVASAFVDVPGHIFVMFDTGIHARDREVLGVDPALLIERHGSLWIPVETTSLGQPFHVAWERGAALVHEWENSDRYAVVDVMGARQRYQASVSAARVPQEARGPNVMATTVVDYVGEDLLALQEMRGTWLQNTYLAKLGAGDDSVERLQLARVYYIHQDYPRAREELDAIPESQRNAATWNNFGDVQLALGDLQGALASYSTARGLDPNDPGIALNRGLALHVVGDGDAGQEELAAAVSGAQGVDGAMDLLGIRASDMEPTSRAGDAVALEQLSLQTIEQLLHEAMGSIPKEQRADSLRATAADSLAGVDKTAPGVRQPVVDAAADSKRTVPTLAGGSRGEQIEAENIIEVLYWKEQ